MIRVATEKDISAMLAVYGPYVRNTAASFEYSVPTEEEFAARFCHHTHSCPWLVWEENGIVTGYAYAMPAFSREAFAWCAEVSVYLIPEAIGRGIGRRLYSALEALLTELGYRVLYAVITDDNVASLEFHQRMGYRTCAVLERCGVKFGRWWGVVRMEKRLGFVEIPTNKPKLWSKFVENNEIIENILDKLTLS
jgi:phosphinothricin acetyltransferase